MTDLPRLRLTIVGVVVLSLFFALFSRLWYLQVIDHDEFAVRAAQNQVRIIYTEAPRGQILDRQGRVLVGNRVSPVVTVARHAVKDRPDVVERLAALLDLPREELEKRIADPNASPYKPVPVAEDVSEELVLYLREHAAEFPGVEATQLARRSYPHGPLAAHLLGYVGEINDTELAERRRKGYRLGDSIGKSGVERMFEEDLRGEPGVLKLEVDSEGRVLRTLASVPPMRGNDVQLTLDLDVQRVTEESLVKGLEAAKTRRDRENREPFKAPAGSAVVVDPRDGSILAMASYPTYDPSEFVNGISRARFAELQDPAGYYPLNNRAVVGQYAPGSTFKVITAMAGIETGKIAPNTTIIDAGSYSLRPCSGKCTFRNAGSRAYGKVNLSRSLTVSSDVYYYKLGAELWRERERYGRTPIQDMARRLGFGERTGVPLPGEARGRVLDPDSKKRLHESAPNVFADGVWRTGDSINLAIGQGDTVVTPLQLANAYAAFGNGGTIWQPRIAARVLTPDGQVARDISPEKRRDVELPGRAAIEAGLRGVMSSKEGTAAAAFAGFPLETFPIAGKTGTAQVARKQDSAIFAAYGPVGAPQYAVSVIMEEAGFGGSTAAPVARRVFDLVAGQPVGELTLGTGVD